MSKVLDTKLARLLLDNDKIKFNRAIISQHTQTISLARRDYIKNLNNLKALNVNNATTSYFVIGRAHSAYIVSIYHLDATYSFIIASLIINPKKKDFKNLKTMITAMRNSFNKSQHFLAFDLNSLVMAMFMDASFAASPKSSSQLGFVISLIDKNGNANIA